MNTAQEKDHSKFLLYYTKFMLLIGLSGSSLFYLQAYEIYQRGSANNVSLEGFLMALFSLICWFVYALIIKNKVMIISNTVAVIGAGMDVVAILMIS